MRADATCTRSEQSYADAARHGAGSVRRADAKCTRRDHIGGGRPDPERAGPSGGGICCRASPPVPNLAVAAASRDAGALRRAGAARTRRGRSVFPWHAWFTSKKEMNCTRREQAHADAARHGAGAVRRADATCSRRECASAARPGANQAGPSGGGICCRTSPPVPNLAAAAARRDAGALRRAGAARTRRGRSFVRPRSVYSCNAWFISKKQMNKRQHALYGNTPQNMQTSEGQQRCPLKFREVEFRLGDWMCQECGAHNYSRRTDCYKCHSKPSGGGSRGRGVADPPAHPRADSYYPRRDDGGRARRIAGGSGVPSPHCERGPARAPAQRPGRRPGNGAAGGRIRDWSAATDAARGPPPT
eukprot:gene8303-22295_t